MRDFSFADLIRTFRAAGHGQSLADALTSHPESERLLAAAVRRVLCPLPDLEDLVKGLTERAREVLHADLAKRWAIDFRGSTDKELFRWLKRQLPQVVRRALAQCLREYFNRSQGPFGESGEGLLYDCFITYCSLDRRKAQRLALFLREQGMRVWFDNDAIQPSDVFLARIQDGLQRSRALVQLLSLEGLTARSDWVEMEVSTVLSRDPMNRKGRYIQVLLDDCAQKLPDALARFHYIDLRGFADSALQSLVEACRRASHGPPDRQAG